MKVYEPCPTTSPFQDLSLTLGKSGWVGKSHEDVIPFDDKSSHWTLNIVKQLSFGKQDTENKGIPATTFRKKAGRIIFRFHFHFSLYEYMYMLCIVLL